MVPVLEQVAGRGSDEMMDAVPEVKLAETMVAI